MILSLSPFKEKKSINEFIRNNNFALRQKTVFNCGDFMVKYKSLFLKVKNNAIQSNALQINAKSLLRLKEITFAFKRKNLCD